MSGYAPFPPTSGGGGVPLTSEEQEAFYTATGTGIHFGLALSGTIGTQNISIDSGAGFISYDGATSAITKVSVPVPYGDIVAPPAGEQEAYIYLDAGGVSITVEYFKFNDDSPQPSQELSRTKIYVGHVALDGAGNIDAVYPAPRIRINTPALIGDVVSEYGAKAYRGLDVSGDVGSLKFNIAQGLVFALGQNWDSDELEPSYISTPPQSPNFEISQRYRDGFGGFTEVKVLSGEIDPRAYDDGTGIPAFVGNQTWTPKLFYLAPSSSGVVVHVELGQMIFGNFNIAINSLIEYINIIHVSNVRFQRDNPLIAVALVRGNCTDTTNVSRCMFFTGQSLGLFK